MQENHYHDEGDKKSTLLFWMLLLRVLNTRYDDMIDFESNQKYKYLQQLHSLFELCFI